MDTAASQALRVRELGGFQLLRELGQGGMGKVFLARQPRLDRQVALKVLQPGLAGDASSVLRFLTEARTAAKFQHPHVVQVYDLGQDEASGLHFIAFEYVSGGSVEQRLREKGRLEEPEALRIAHAVAQALVFAESQGLVHRDIKPENVLLAGDGTPKLADLGLVKDVQGGAQVTQTGVVLGTPHYMAPEQALGDRPLDVRTDIYALGLCLWRCLTGLVPYDEERNASVLQILNRHIHTDLPDVRQRAPQVSAATAALIARMVARDPDQRPASAAELVAALGARLRELGGKSASGQGPAALADGGGPAAPAAGAQLAPAPTGAAAATRRGSQRAGVQAVPPTAPAPQDTEDDEAPDRTPALVLGGVMVLLLALLGVGLSLAFYRPSEEPSLAAAEPADPPAAPASTGQPPSLAQPEPPEAPPVDPVEAPLQAPVQAPVQAPEVPAEVPSAPTPAAVSPAEPPPPPIADAAQVAHQTRTQFMVLAGSVRRALREDLLRLGRLLPELHEMYAAHGPTWSAEDQACARRVLELATGLLEMLQADDPEAQERGRKRMLATLPADEQAALSKPELLALLVARHEERAPTAPDEGLIAELYLTRLVVHHLRQEDAAPRDPGAGLRPRERVRAALRALLDGALVGKEQLEAYRADPSSPPTRAKDLVEAERLLEEEWALLPSDGRQARGRALQERLEPLARTLLGVSYLAELETFLQLAAILGQDPCSHSRAWFVLHAHRSPPPALLSARIAPPRPHERCRGLLAAREGQGEVKLALRIPRPGKEQRLELALGSKVRVDGKELLVPPEARGWQTALIELDPPAGNLVIHLQDERLGLLGTPLHVPLGGCPPDFAFEEQRGGGALLALDAPAPEPPDPMPGRGRRPPGRRGN